MIRFLLILICFQSLLFASLCKAQDQKLERFALVIGNQNYKVSPLRNSLNDANSMSDALTELGFSVFTLNDANAKDMAETIERFYNFASSHKSPNKLAVVYYAGHAIQVNQSNYLIPLGLEFDSQDSFISSLYHLSDLFSHMQNIPGLKNIVILDACRDNPFEGSLNTPLAQGLAPVKAPADTLIAFATAPGGLASDGSSKNGIYTKHLLRYLPENIPVEEMFKKVRAKVAKETRNKQIPWEHSSLLTDLYFSPPKNKNLPNIVVF